MRIGTKKLIELIKANEAVYIMNHGENYTLSVKVSKAQMLREVKYIDQTNDEAPIWTVDVFTESKEVYIN